MDKPISTHPIIDWDQKSRFGANSEQLQRELLTIFAKELPGVKNQINQAFADNNFDELYDILHKLQGGCAYCGLPRLRLTADGSSKIIKNKKKLTAELLKNLNDEIDAVLTEFSKKIT